MLNLAGMDSTITTEMAATSQNRQDKRTLYKTAQATIGCALFNAGDFVAVKYGGQSEGNHWFEVSPSKDFASSTMYHETQLAHFCL